MEEKDMLVILEQKQAGIIRRTNDYANQFGLHLTESDIGELLLRRRECLTDQQRVEFGTGVLDKIVFAFCDSDYIDQRNYMDTISRLQNIFYMYKNEAMDELTDDELIGIMKEAFDGECQGSLEYLEETFLEKFAREIRFTTRKFIGRYVRSYEENGHSR